MVLKKDAALFERDEKGELIPQERELIIDEEDPEQKKYKGEKVKIVPFARGELRKLFSALPTKEGKNKEEESDLDEEVIVEKCKQPQFTKEEVLHMRPGLSTAIVNTILYESGIDTRKQSKKKALEGKEDEFSKNSEELNQNEKKGI